MVCEKCGDPSLGRLCVHCSGQRVRPPSTVLTGEQWNERLVEAAERAAELVAADSRAGAHAGRDALAHMLAAHAIVAACPALPSFEWYAAQVAERWPEMIKRGQS